MYSTELRVKYKYWTKKDEAFNYRFIVYTDWDAVEPEGYSRITRTQAEKLCILERKARIKARLTKAIRPVESDTFIWPYPLPANTAFTPIGICRLWKKAMMGNNSSTKRVIISVPHLPM